MFLELFFRLRVAGLPVSTTELLTLCGALSAGLARDQRSFYQLCRTTLIKDERYYDRFDCVFNEFLQGAQSKLQAVFSEIPTAWLHREDEAALSEDEREQIERMGGWDELMEAFKERLQEQHERHQGGNKWIGTAGTSPFGARGAAAEGYRISQEGSRNRSAVKVWERRDFRNLDDRRELGVRNLKLALRRLRHFSRVGARDELDLEQTIQGTAHNGGLLDIKLRPERRNTVKVLLCLDVGGSMDAHATRCEELFTAARSEFRQLAFFYFHNMVYERLWRDNRRRLAHTVDTAELLRTHGRDYKLVLVGDASMSPHEISAVGGSVEHWNELPGAQWLQRLLAHFNSAVWLSPEPEGRWRRTPSSRLIHELMGSRMYHLSPRGIEAAMRELMRPRPPGGAYD